MSSCAWRGKLTDGNALHCEDRLMPTDSPAGSPRYLVEIPFRAAKNGRLSRAPYQLPDGAQVEQQIRNHDRPLEEQPAELLRTQKTFGADGRPIEEEATDEILDDSLTGRYRYCVTLAATDAEHAVASAEAAAKALLDVLAANGMAFEIGAPKDRYVRRLDPPTDPIPDTELLFQRPTRAPLTAIPGILPGLVDATCRQPHRS